jgi:glycine cleavage system H protein
MEKHFPEDLLYTADHEWCRIDGDIATIGITWHAQDALGDVVYCEFPQVGETISQGQTFGVVESVKAVSDLFAPVSGEVVERNEDIIEAPAGLNDDTYDDGWLIRVKLRNKDELSSLLSQEAYEKLLSDLE